VEELEKIPNHRANQPSSGRRLLRHLLDFSIRLKIISPYLLLTFIVMAAGVYGVVTLVAGSLDERLNNHLVEAGVVVADTLVRQELKHQETARALAFTKGFAEALVNQDHARVREIVEPIAVNENLENLIVLDAQGEQLLHLVQQDNALLDVQRPFEAEDVWIIHTLLTEGNPEAPPQRGLGQHPINGRYYYFTAMPVAWEDELVGVVTIGTSLNTFLPTFKSTSLADVTIYFEEGEAIASTFTAAMGPTETQALLTELSISPMTYNVRRMTPELTALDNVRILDREYRVAMGPLRIGNESLAVFSVALPTDFIFTASRTSRNTYIGIIVFAAAAVILVGYVISQRITRPVQQLVHASQAVADGDLERRTGVQSNDEIGVLASTFDQMTDRLAERTYALRESLRIQRETASRMRSILSSIGDGVLMEGRDGSIEPLNQAAERMLQQMAENFTFAPLQELSVPEQELLDGAEENPWLVESRRFQVGDSVFTAHSAAVRTDEDERLGTVIVLRDVTAEVEAEQLKDAFVEHVSHELRTPLTVIKGYSSLLLATAGSALNEQQRMFLQTIVTNTESLVSMINALLDFSEMEATGKLGLRTQPLEIGALVEEVTDEWTDQMADKDLDFVVKVAPDLPPVSGDEARLRLAVVNLVRNAWEYTEEGQVTVHVTGQSQAGRERPQVVIAVQDTGMGISADDQRHIFSRFYRAMKVRENERRGLGLGLYVTKAIVDAHRGEITVESREGVGSTFTMTLPAIADTQPTTDSAEVSAEAKQAVGLSEGD
jgi:signal transduction histidine kinase